MKFLYLKAKNFATIFTGMKRREIEIDFRKCKNRVVLFVGDNGTGKTAILSLLHPFAAPGNMDVRNTSGLIIEEQDGYKELHIQNGEDVYIIKHFYLFKANKGMKSYISKNGAEMNPNGNVNSFLEVVNMELGVAPEYLKLLRLGSNVSTFIRSKATERKTFASKLLSDIDIYSKFYKKINEDSRLLKSLMKSVTDKIDKLRIYDEKEELKHLSELEAQLKLNKEIRDTINSEIGRIDGSINILVHDGLDCFIAEIRLKHSEYKRITSEIEGKKSKLKKFDVIIMGNVDKSIKETEQQISSNSNQIIVNKNMMEFYFNQLNSLHEQKKEKEDSLKYIASDLEYSRLNDLYLQLHRDREKFEKRFKSFTPKCTRDEMLTALGVLQEIEKFVSDIYEFDTNAVDNVLGHFINGQSVEWVARKELSKIEDKISRLNRSLSIQAQTSNIDPNKLYILFKPDTCNCNCPFQEYYEDATGRTIDDKVDIQSELKSLETKRDFFLSFPNIAKKVEYILLLIKSYKSLAEKMPENFFDVKHILTSIKSFTPFFDEEYITNYISLLEDYEEYKELDSKIKEVLHEKIFIEKNSNSFAGIQKELESLDVEIYKVSTDLDKLREDNKLLTNRNEGLEDLLERLKSFKDYSEEIQNQLDESQVIYTELDKMKRTEDHVSELVTIRREKQNRLTEVDRDIERMETDINNIKFRLREFNSLNEERIDLEDKFEDINIIKEALSSNKGIPLLFMQLYLRNSRMMVNQLLDTVYSGELEVGEFIINEKEFRIPYTKNGIIIEDVSFCSQGEESFLSMALSFALIEQSIKDYNIMLLDEIDATLDTKKREQFLNILEEQLEAIGAEQVFLITHNNMFDNYPVDIIMTSDKNIDNYRNTNIIFAA